MVEILPAPRVVGADRLDVAVAVGADPDIAPGGRDDERLGTLAVLRRDGRAVRPHVGEALAPTHALDARPLDVAPSQSHDPSVPVRCAEAPPGRPASGPRRPGAGGAGGAERAGRSGRPVPAGAARCRRRAPGTWGGYSSEWSGPSGSFTGTMSGTKISS